MEAETRGNPQKLFLLYCSFRFLFNCCIKTKTEKLAGSGTWCLEKGSSKKGMSFGRKLRIQAAIKRAR